MQVCTWEKIHGVFAHELANICNILIGLVAAAVVTALLAPIAAALIQVACAQAGHFIVNPLNGRDISFANLFRTQPTTDERVRRLRAVT